MKGTTLTATLFVFLLLGRTLAAEPWVNFEAPRSHLSGVFGPGGSAAGDWDGDGDLDMITVVSYPTNSVFLWKNNGSGEFEHSAAPFHTLITHVVMATLDNDSRSDAIFADLTGKVYVCYSRPDRSMFEGNGYQTREPLLDLKVFDANGDGRLDILATHTNALTILIAQENEVFEVGSMSTLTPNRQVMVTQVDEDMTPDLVTMDGTEQIQIYIGDGSGGFVHQGGVTIARPISGGTAADFNGDGKEDLALVFEGEFIAGQLLPLVPSELLVLTNNGGHYNEANRLIVSAMGHGIKSDDLNGDGKPDLLVRGWGLSVLLGGGNGNFVVHPVVKPGYSVHSIWPGDFNGDGQTDLSLAFDLPASFTIYEGLGGGRFQTTPSIKLDRSTGEITVGKFNSDSFPDLITHWNEIIFGSSDFPLVMNNLQLQQEGIWTPVVADFDGDGALDIAVTTREAPDHSAVVYKGNGLGGFSKAFALEGTNQLHFQAAVDFDGDGNVDVLEGSGRLSIIRGLGENELGSTYPLPITNAGNSGVADLNNDNRPDIVTIKVKVNSIGDSEIVAGINQGNFAFDFRPVLRYPRYPIFRVATADVNGDGNVDVVVLRPTNKELQLDTLLGEGNGTFKMPLVSSIMPYPYIQEFGLADFDGDGVLDVCLQAQDWGTITFAQGNRQGGFHHPVTFAVSGALWAFQITDINNDGGMDVLNGSSNFPDGGLISILYNATSSLELTIKRVDNGVLLSWREKFNNAVLQKCSRFGEEWQAVELIPTLQNGMFEVRAEAFGESRFYRLLRLQE